MTTLEDDQIRSHNTSDNTVSSIETFELEQFDDIPRERRAAMKYQKQQQCSAATLWSDFHSAQATFMTIPQCVKFIPKAETSRSSIDPSSSAQVPLLDFIPSINNQGSSTSSMPQHHVDIDRFAMERLAPVFLQSTLSQQALQEWDRRQGLSPSHARTTLDSGRTRKMLLDFLSTNE